MMAEAVKPNVKRKSKAKKSSSTVVSSDKLSRNREVEKIVEDKGLKLHEFELADSRRTSESVIGKTEESPPKETTENCIILESSNNINSEMTIVDQCESINISNSNKETVQSETLQVAGNIASSDIITSTKFQAPSAPLAQEQTPIYSYRESNSQRELPKLIESSSYELKCSNLYPTLPSNKSLTIVNKQVSPSCPSEVQLSSSNVKTIYPNLHAENSKMHKPKPQLVNEMMLRSNEIRPLTKDQLKQLYLNPELDRNETYIESFVKSEQSVEHHWLYKLILKYAKAREDYALSEKCIKDLKNEYSRERDRIWEDFPETVVEKSVCMDRKSVKAIRSYIRASYNQRTHETVKKILENTYKEIEKNYCLHLHVMETTRLLIESHLYSISSSSTFKDILETAPVTGYEIRNCSKIDHGNILLLKQCISVLFCFQRRLTKDEEFLKETRIWLTSLVALLLRVATYEDHLFILNHILRCPARVGSWACSYIQSPTLPSWSNAINNTGFKSPLLDHTITMLATLLYPVRSREVFLQHFKSSVMLATGCDAPQDNHWVFIDSDNEEDLEAFDMWLRWEESDIVSFFTQIPFGNMFRFLLKIEESEAIEKYNPEKYESTEMLKLLSVATHLVSIFHEGFKTFRSGKYRQLTKYITQYISDSVKYVCEHWECVSKMNKFDSAFMKRLQAEFDEFIFRAVSCISSAPRKEAWQFLIFPYRSVSSEMMWKLAWVLFTYPERQEITIPMNDMVLKLQDEKLKSLFQETIESLEFNEAYYLLSALSEMVNSRGWDEHQFVHTITLILFEVAFTAHTIREKMSKGGRDMIKTIVEKHPYVVSSLLRELKDKINDVGKASIYLFKELPLQGWKPTQEDINIVSHWLLSDDFPLKSSTNQLARLIISNINWGRNEEGTELMLDISIHQKIAVLIVEAYGKFIKLQDNKSYIIWAYEQLASFASAVKSTMSTATSTDEEGFIKWAWEMLFTLRLHSLDQADPPYEDVLKGCVIRDGIPTIHQDVWVLPLSSINDSPVNCTACYVAILLTSLGHRADLIREEGFSLLHKLIENKQYVAAISVLPYIMPFFYKDFNGLVKNETFNKCVQLLLTADIDDMSYLQKAKSMVGSETLGKVLPVMGSMIKFQVEKAKRMNASCDVVRLWLRILFDILISAIKTGKLDKWKGSNQVYYLLDEITRIAFTDTCMRDVAFMEIKSVEKHLSLPAQEGSGFIDTLASLMIPRSPQKASFLSDSIPCKYLWFTWFAIHVELESNNSKNIWNQLLLELAVQPSITVGDALKKVTGSLKIKMPINCLPIYKWGQLIMKTPSTHPLLPLFCQQFFIYYLQRISPSQGLPGKVCSGKKFFENNNIIGSLKEMKVHLLAARDENYKLTVYYQAQLSSDKIPPNRQDLLMNKKEFYERLVKLYDAFTLWLEAPRLQEATVVISDLPERYDPSRLSCILNHDVDPWFMFVDVQKLQEDVNEQLNSWHCYNKFSEVALVADMKMSKESSEQHIVRKLNSYAAPKPPPPIKRSKPPLNDITEEIFDNYKILKGVIEKDLETLKESIEWFSNQMLKARELDREYHNDIIQLYNNKEKKISCKVSCSKGEEDTPGGCTGAAIIFMSFEEKEINEKVKQAIENNRINQHILITSLLEPLRKSFYYAAAHMSKCFEILLLESKGAEQSLNVMKHQELCKMGKMLFYYLLDCFDDNINSFQPTKVFLTEQLQFLFMVFQEDESQGMQLLQSLTSHPFVESLLPVIDQFNPMAHSGNSYVQTYMCLVEQIHKLPLNVTLTLVNKFDISLWLQSSKRMFEERTKLIHALGRALCQFGQQQLNEMGPIYKMYNNHLRVMLIYNFPEHYYEILNMLLSGTDSPSLPKEAWTTFLHSLGLTLTSEITIENKEIIEQYASKQSFLSSEEVTQTLHLLGDHFERNCKTTEKLDLYKKYSYYMPSIINILAAMSHAFIHTKLSVITHNENDDVVELWETLKKTYSPWLYPTQKRSPWSLDSTGFAALMFGSYTMCLCYLEKNIKDTFQGASILPIVWRYYVETYSQKYVEDHVRATAQECLSSLKWNEFSPELEDISLMIELVESQIPENVNFVSSIFVKISWTNINYLSGGANETTSDTEILPVLTKLIVKLAWEPAIIEAGTLPQILKSAEACSWHLVSFKTLEQVVNVFVEKCNPQCILQEKQNGSMDAILLRFLRITTCMEPLELLRNHPDTLCHRLLFMATCVDLLKKCSVTSPELLKDKQNLFLKAVYNIMQQIEISTKCNAPQPERFKQTVKMLGQFLVILSHAARVELKDFVMMGLIQWFEERPDSYLVLPCLQASCKSVNCMQYLVKIVECCIAKHFYTNKEAIYVLRYLMVPEQYEEEFLTACSKENMHLSQYIYAEQKLLEYKDKEDIRLLNMLVDWNEEANPQQSSEPKLILLWDKILALALRQIDADNELDAKGSLKRFIKKLTSFGKESSFIPFLNKATYQVTPRFRFLSRFVVAFVSVQIPDNGSIRIEAYAEGHITYTGASSPVAKEKTICDGKCKPSQFARDSVQRLESLLNSRQYGNMKDYIEEAVNSVMDANNHLRNIRTLLKLFTTRLYDIRCNKFLELLNQTLPEER